MLDFSADITPEATAYALKLVSREQPEQPAAAKGGALARQSPRSRLLVELDKTNGDGDLRPDRLSESRPMNCIPICRRR